MSVGQSVCIYVCMYVHVLTYLMYVYTCIYMYILYVMYYTYIRYKAVEMQHAWGVIGCCLYSSSWGETLLTLPEPYSL